MINRTRVLRLYMKDLLDILRDRRTLIAMIVVPIVLYPLLMLGSIQAATMQADQMKEELVIIGVETEYTGKWLEWVIRTDVAMVDSLQEEQDETFGSPLAELNPIRSFKVVPVLSRDLESWVQQNQGHCALRFPREDLPIPTDWSDLSIRRPDVIFDSADVRSDLAGKRLVKIMERHAGLLVDERARSEGLPYEFIHPMQIQEIDVASAETRGGSMLGQVIPLILILLTMTGAIYPAIDLTAGERERGTLETLMVCPVPVVEIISGKFLVVTTVAVIGAALNLFSMGLTLQFGGFNRALASGADTAIPVHVLPLILLYLIPLAVFFSAILLAVCSFAHTFKEAQNYVTPIIMAVLVPAGIAALPGTQLNKINTVMPVANMVLLTRDMLTGKAELGATLTVLISTCVYALTAVAVAIRIFGQEAVAFVDSGSWRAQFDRRRFLPKLYPTPVFVLIYVALLFPIWFYLQSSLPLDLTQIQFSLTVTQMLMVLLFLLIPVICVVYYKISLTCAFNLHWPKPRYLLGAFLIGCSSWAIAHTLMLFQNQLSILGWNEDVLKMMQPYDQAFLSMPILPAILLLAIIPAVCEEVMFRGLLLSGLRQTFKKWSVIIAVGLIFSVFHYMIQRFVITFGLGIMLAYLCWQSRSIIPGILAHMMHNGVTLLRGLPGTKEPLDTLLQISPSIGQELPYLPWHVLGPAVILLLVGLWLFDRQEAGNSPQSSATRLRPVSTPS